MTLWTSDGEEQQGPRNSIGSSMRLKKEETLDLSSPSLGNVLKSSLGSFLGCHLPWSPFIPPTSFTNDKPTGCVSASIAGCFLFFIVFFIFCFYSVFVVFSYILQIILFFHFCSFCVFFVFCFIFGRTTRGLDKPVCLSRAFSTLIWKSVPPLF